MFAPLAPYGVGLIRFSIDGLRPLLPHAAHGALSTIARAALPRLLALRWTNLWRDAYIFPSVIPWFAWRSLQNYSSLAAVPAIVAEEGLTGDDTAVAPGRSPSVSTE